MSHLTPNAAPHLVGPPPHLVGALPHLVGALPQLQSYNDMGYTVYALTVFGAHRGATGGAVLAGPAVSAAGVTPDWPSEAQHAAKTMFAKSPLRNAGTVVVVLIVHVGRELHCTLIVLPTAGKKRARRDAEIPLSCAAWVLASDY